MQHRNKPGGAIVVLFALAASVFAQDVKTDYDRHVDFSQYKTYSWGKVQTENPLWQQRITDAVDQDLQEKGWQKVESGGDVTLMAVGATRNQRQYQTFYDGLGGWRWGGFGRETTTTVENYRVGTLVLDIYDNNSKRLIWRGSGSDTLSDKPEKNEKDLGKAVHKMFKDFPPKTSER
jgi:hypothetical protein